MKACDAEAILAEAILATVTDIEARLGEAFPAARVAVAGAGDRFEVRVVAEAFRGLGAVKRQQAVYAALRDLIASGEIHAVIIKAHPPGED